MCPSMSHHITLRDFEDRLTVGHTVRDVRGSGVPFYSIWGDALQVTWNM